MARKNKLGSSFMALGLPKAQDKLLIQWLIDKDVSGKKLLRYLVQAHLKKEGLVKEEPKSYML